MNEIIKDTDQQANTVIDIYKGLEWVLGSLDPGLFEYFWTSTSEGHFISKLRAHLSSLEKDVDNNFPVDRKELFKKAIEKFIEIYSNYQAAKIPETRWYFKSERYLEKKWHLNRLRKQGKIAFCETHLLLANCQKN